MIEIYLNYEGLTPELYIFDTEKNDYKLIPVMEYQ